MNHESARVGLHFRDIRDFVHPFEHEVKAFASFRIANASGWFVLSRLYLHSALFSGPPPRSKLTVETVW